MTHFTDLFSPETYAAFIDSPRDVSGFRRRQLAVAGRVRPGDKLLCYLTKLGRWFGMLEVLDRYFIDDAPVFYPEEDPFVVRFKVKPLVLLELDKSIPIRDDEVWRALSFTRDHDKTSNTWTGKLRGSLVRVEDSDARVLAALLQKQSSPAAALHPLSEAERKLLTPVKVRRADRDVVVSVPVSPDSETEDGEVPEHEVRESRKIQALIADIGNSMRNIAIWLPRNDRAAVLKLMKTEPNILLDRLPLNYDDATLTTIENIDVLWIRNRSIVRAFEVEHSTSVYSGILRMADLLALQPNMDIKLHIVAPEAKREKVFQELKRPVFSLLERGPLAEACTYLSYDSIRALAALEHMAHMEDTVLDEYAEDAE